MTCLVYQLKHVSHSSVIFPFATMTVADLPKSVRHEIDPDKAPSRLVLLPGNRHGYLNDDEALKDIKTDGYHIQGTTIAA